MHSVVRNEMAKHRIADFHRQAEMYRHSRAARDASAAPASREGQPSRMPVLVRWALAGVLLSMLTLGGVGLSF